MTSKDHTGFPASHRPMQGQKLVFRVPNYKPNESLVCGSEESSARVYHSRKSHRKSRAGCVNCKQRRVKCDETKPHCIRCQKHGVECGYTDKSLLHQKPDNNMVFELTKNRKLTSIDSLASSASSMMISDKLNELLRPSISGKPLSKEGRDGATDCAIQALHHFSRGPAFAGGTIRVAMEKMLELAFETPFLMHAIIAAATTHICTHAPDSKAYRVAEAYHWQQTINQYSAELSKPITRQSMDKLYSACMMISMHSFIQEKFNPRSSFVFSTDPASLAWLRLQSGLRYLIERSSHWLTESMWWTFFMESRDPTIDFEDKRPGRVGLDPDLADLCGITDDTTVESSPLLWPLRMLMGILPLERGTKSVQTYHTWMGRIENPFFECLWKKEAPALILLAWWLGLMCYVEEWWVKTRVRSECTAICMFLEHSSDPLVLKTLKFPASCCGYLLRHELEQKDVIELNLGDDGV